MIKFPSIGLGLPEYTGLSTYLHDLHVFSSGVPAIPGALLPVTSCVHQTHGHSEQDAGAHSLPTWSQPAKTLDAQQTRPSSLESSAVCAVQEISTEVINKKFSNNN